MRDSRDAQESGWSPRQWGQIESHLSQLLAATPEQRSAYLDKLQESDADLGQLVHVLLKEELADPDFLRPFSTQGHAKPVHLESGVDVGAFVLERELGRGGMGEVWLARRRSDFSQLVAVKVVQVSRDPSSSARLEFERQLMAQLQHPGIAALLDGGTLDDGRPYLILEYIDGVPLDEYCEREGLCTRERVLLFLQVLESVEYAHQRLVVHRDLKPSNILVDGQGRVRLLDFGIAKLLEGEGHAGLTLTGRQPLTPRYASPEQVEGLTVTTSTDVYSLGVVLYEVLASVGPYGDDKNALQLLQAIDAGQHVPPSRVAPTRRRSRELHGELDWITLKALERRPASRYASVTSLTEDLQRYLVGSPVSVAPNRISYLMRKLLQRHKLPLGVSAAGLGLLLAVGLLALQQARTAWKASEAQAEARRTTLNLLQFAESTFRFADPRRSLGPTATTHEFLDEALRQVDGIEDPLIRVGAYEWLGVSLEGAGRYVDAERLARRGIAEAQLAGLEPIDYFKLHLQLAQVLGARGERREGRRHCEIALRALESTKPTLFMPERLRRNCIQVVKLNLANMMEDDDYDGSRALSLELEQEFIEERDEQDADFLVVRFNRLASEVNRGSIADLPRQLEEVRAGFLTRVDDEAHFWVVVVDYARCLVHMARGEWGLAREVLSLTTPRAMESLGSEHPWAIKFEVARAWLLLEEGDLENACELAENLLQGAREGLEDEVPLLELVLAEADHRSARSDRAATRLQRLLRETSFTDIFLEAWARLLWAEVLLQRGERGPSSEQRYQARELLAAVDEPQAPLLARLRRLEARSSPTGGNR